MTNEKQETILLVCQIARDIRVAELQDDQCLDNQPVKPPEERQKY